MESIYIVEDEAIVALETEQRLIDLGYKIAGIADNSRDAVENILLLRPNLVLMDINIKGMIDGIETAKMILHEYDVPIIYLTAYSDKATLLRAKETTPFGYIIKPSDEHEISVAIEIALSKFKMEKKIKENEARLSVTLQSIADGVISIDNDYRITFVNRTAEHLCGCDSSEAKGKLLSEIFKTADEKKNQSTFNPAEQVISYGREISFPLRILLNLRTEEEKYISLNCSPIKDDAGKIEGAVVVFTDLTEIYRKEEQLDQSEKLYQDVIEKASDIIYTTDLQGNINQVNSAAINASGFSLNELLSKNVFNLVPPEYRDLLRKFYFRQYLNKQTSSYLESPIVKKDGAVAWFGQIVNLIYVNDKVSGFHVISRDITEIKKAQDALKQSEETLRLIIDILPDRIYLKDKEGRFLLNNKAHLAALGLKYQFESQNKTDFDFRDAEISNRYKKQDDFVIENKQPLIDADENIIDINGQQKWLKITKLPFIREDGIVRGIVGISKDVTEMKKAEDELKESNRRFMTLANISPVGIFRTDNLGKITYVNPRWSEISGLSEEQSLKDIWFSKVHEEDKISLKAEWFSAIRDRKSSRFDFRFIQADGTIKWVMLNFEPEMEEANKLIGFVGTVSDITQRKQNELEIMFLANVLRNINECVSITDLENNFLFVNHSFLSTYGYTEEELIGKHISIVNPREYKEGTNETVLQESLSGGWKGELINRRKEGTEFPIYLSTTPIFNSDHQLVAVIGVASDISDRKQQEAEINRMNQAIVQSPVSIIITNLDGNIQYVNQKTIETSGYTKEELIGKKPNIFRSGNQNSEIYSSMWGAIKNGKEWHGELLNKKKSGALHWEAASISPLKDQNGNTTHYIAFKEDICKQKMLEKNLVEAKDKAEAANDLKDAFIANISHEIRTPLNGILGMLSLIKSSFEDYIKQDEDEYFESIERSSKRIIRTVEMIINFSRLQIGDFTSEIREINLTQFINREIIDFRLLAERKGIELIFKETSSNSVYSDTFCLSQILTNLVDNAIKYTVDGKVEISTFCEDKNVIIEISDTGIGMSEEYQKLIFTPYTQEEVGYTRSYEGVGLGLSLVKRFAELIKAKISVKSEKGQGTIFTIRIPGDCSKR